KESTRGKAANPRTYWADSWRNVYVGELEVRPPGAPTTGSGESGHARPSVSAWHLRPTIDATDRGLIYIALQCIRTLRMDMSKDLVAASATPLVLAILTEGDSYGYAIIKRVAELSGGHLQWTDGMLYPVLH